MTLVAPPEPYKTTRKDTFIINDVYLVVPPSSISVQMEDLVYSTRALRTRTTTKQPSGQGQIAVSVNIVFPGEDLLDLHRLLVQFRASPYLYIENRYLRERIVPQWNLNQNMAFTLLAADLRPLPGSSDAWVLGLSLTWFNYFPFVHNYFFRKEWQTNWLHDGSNQSEGNQIRHSIGWEWIDGKRVHRPSVVATRTSEEVVHRQRGVVQEELESRDRLTLKDLETLHLGAEWDLLPVPGNMAVSQPVAEPARSQIYVRYMNYLQRDALKDNFDIDVENDLTGDARSAFFGAVLVGSEYKTYGLHSGTSHPEIGPIWRDAARRWRTAMQQYHNGVRFVFNTYQSIKFPPEWTQRAQKAQKTVLQEVLSTIGSPGSSNEWLEFYSYSNGKKGSKPFKRIPMRSGMGSPNGFHTPIGKKNGSFYNFKELVELESSRVKMRNPEDNKRLYGANNPFPTTQNRPHYGTDFAVGGGTPVYAVRDGTVERALSADSGEGTYWYWYNVPGGTRDVVTSTHYEDWLASVSTISLAAKSIDIRKGRIATYRLAETVDNREGVFVKSIGYPGVYYYTQYSAGGRYVRISHNVGGHRSVSLYMHLDEIDVSVGQEVKAGTRIGTTGNSATYNIEYLDWYFKQIKDTNNETGVVGTYYPGPLQEESVAFRQYSLPYHLHFEYWEAVKLGAPVDMGSAEKTAWRTGYTNMVCVDPVPSFKRATNQLGTVLDVVAVSEKEKEVVQGTLDEQVEKGNISVDEAGYIAQELERLSDAGWVLYSNTNLSNVWYRTNTAHVVPSQVQGLKNISNRPEIFGGENALLTGCTGGLRNIVANLPILGHEYPTQQYLGSMEPVYSFEFALLDDREDLEGVPRIGAWLEGMRSVLQHNARKFREVADSWCVATDSFITRMLGTFRVDDLLEDYREVEDERIISERKLRKRTSIVRADGGTVEGNPGLSYINFEVSETNPYEIQKVSAAAASKQSRDEMRAQVLQAIAGHSFDEKYKEKALFILFAQLAQGTGDSGGVSSALEVPVVSASRSIVGLDDDVVGLVPDLGGLGERAVIQDTSGIYADLLDKLGTNYTRSSVEESVLVIPIEELGYDFPRQDRVSTEAGSIGDTAVAIGDGNRYVRATYDIEELLNDDDYASLAQLPIAKISDFYRLVREIVRTAELSLSESSGRLDSGRFEIEGGLDPNFIKEKVYGLTVEPKMWRAWQAYVEKIARGRSLFVRFLENAHVQFEDVEGDAAVAYLTKNRNWLVFDSHLDSETKSLVRSLSPDLTEVANQIKNVSALPFEVVIDAIQAIVSPIDFVFNNEHHLQSTVAEYVKDGILSLTTRYLRGFPLAETKYKQIGAAYALETSIGRLVTSLVGSNEELDILSLEMDVTTSILKEQAGEINYLYKQLYANLLSCGSMVLNPFTGGLFFHVLENNGIDPGTASSKDFVDGLGIPATNSPFKWITTEALEEKKLREITNALSELADKALSDYDLLRAYGLEHLALISSGMGSATQDAYPDMVLPSHPYYGDRTSMTPDFYMWNIYEDSGARAPELLAQVERSVEYVIDECHNSMRAMQKGEEYNPRTDPFINESSDIYEGVSSTIKLNAEGTDGDHDGENDRGPMASPYYPSSQTKQYTELFLSGLEEKVKKNKEEAEARATEDSDETAPVRAISADLAQVAKLNPPGIRLSNTEGIFGLGGGIQYPRRASSEKYKELEAELAGFDARQESMFGSKLGYLGQHLNKETSPDLFNQLKGTNLEHMDEYAHLFDPASLKSLAKASSKDIVSQKMTLKRAYPTFKLYFVEEDQLEDRLLAFDDFHSYNGVTSFSVVLDRKSAADVAVITLQNAAGALDGTQRDAIADLDYFSKVRDAPEDASTTGETSSATNTASEQPFGAVVLRPGLNVQLRAGYSNAPNSLHVLISGRIIDLSWNKRGDVAEIMVQSFGTELVQALKGSHWDEAGSQVYHTTHQLLGALMLEPEIVHFGRWEVGQLFQVGESKDGRIDFFDYSREGFLGPFKYAHTAAQWLLDSPFILFGGAIGLAALNFLPGAGGALGKLAKFSPGARFLSKVKGGTAFLGGSTAGRFTKAAMDNISDLALKTPLAAMSAAQRGRAVAEMGSEFNLIRKVLGSKESTKAALSTLDDQVATVMKQVMAGGGPAAGTTLESAGAGLSAAYRAGLTSVGKGLVTPAGIVTGTSGIGVLGRYGWQGLEGVGSVFANASKLIAEAAVVGGVLSAFTALVLKPMWSVTGGHLKRVFSAAEVKLQLSPQDDNLFPPHPKDYMYLKDRPILHDIGRWGLFILASSFNPFGDTESARDLTNQASKYFLGYDYIDKMVDPEACEYQLDNVTVWDVFHEMSLRHPGWIYGTRPYGNEFRYTMFFGVPSQRYWSKPGSSVFIQRVNDLNRYLSAGQFSEAQYRQLFGNGTEIGPLDKVEEIIGQSLRTEVQQYGELTTQSLGDAAAISATPNPILGEEQTGSFLEEEVALRKRVLLAVPALKEYLRALEVRFVPFRRYHVLSSDNDLIWNGIMSSENAVYNAVDVPYYKTSSDTHDYAESPYGTSLFKAHSFIPEYQLRILPLQKYRNCKSYNMAMRYGMGTLLHTMREMYRGELLSVGNPRMRPWDITILMDSYNDMVGPVEIERVVHTFSHETGFITEIKPSAVVFGNEISSWPVLEGLKVWALAIKDIDESYSGKTVQSKAGIDAAADIVNAIQSDDFTTPLKARQRKLAEDLAKNYPEIQRQINAVGGDNLISEDWVKGKYMALAGLAGAAGGLAAGAGAIGTARAIGGITGAAAAPLLGGLAAVATVGSLGASYYAIDKINNTSLASLLGGYLLFLQCLKEDSVVVVPLLKNGQPIVSGISIQDPSMLWTHFRGRVRRYTADMMEGTADLLSLWSEYGQHAWTQLPDWDAFGGRESDSAAVSQMDMTGE